MIAAKHGYSSAAEKLINGNADVNYFDEYSKSPLTIAAQYGNTDIVRLLATAKADLEQENDLGSTAVHLAVVHGHLNTVKQLVEAKSDINHQDNEFHSTIIKATHNNEPAVLRYLLDLKVNPNIADGIEQYIEEVEYRYHIPLVVAAANGYSECLRLLIANKANVNYQSGLDGHNIFMSAVILGSNQSHLNNRQKQSVKECLTLLLTNNADINHQSYNGRNALMSSTKSERIDMVEFLLQNGANVALTDGDDNTAFQIAQQSANNIDAKITKLQSRIADAEAVTSTYVAYPNKVVEKIWLHHLFPGQDINPDSAEAKAALLSHKIKNVARKLKMAVDEKTHLQSIIDLLKTHEADEPSANKRSRQDTDSGSGGGGSKSGGGAPAV
jgi:ankyrin repeat protein